MISLMAGGCCMPLLIFLSLTLGLDTREKCRTHKCMVGASYSLSMVLFSKVNSRTVKFSVGDVESKQMEMYCSSNGL